MKNLSEKPDSLPLSAGIACYPSMELEDFCWSERSPFLLPLILNQRTRLICWAISIVRQLECLYKLEGNLVTLSVQELLDCLPRDAINRNTGELWDFEALTNFMTTIGTVEESANPFSSVIRRAARDPLADVQRFIPYRVSRIPYNGMSILKFERDLRTALERSPIAARIIVAEGFDQIPGNSVYRPDEANVIDGVGHMVLIIGCGRDENGLYWIAQDSFGTNQGQDGYIRIARFDNIVTDYFEIILDRPTTP